MLPSILPPFPERTRFEIYASMTPATESTNRDKELFGTGRVVAALNKHNGNDPTALLHGIKAEVEKFDDLTILGIKLT